MEIIIDASFLGEKEQAHEYLKEILDLPDHYGRNLDALYDCLSEMNDLQIVIKNVPSAGEYYERLLPVFRDAAGSVVIERDPAGETEFDRLSEPSNCAAESDETDETLAGSEVLGDYDDFSDGDN